MLKKFSSYNHQISSIYNTTTHLFFHTTVNKMFLKLNHIQLNLIKFNITIKNKLNF